MILDTCFLIDVLRGKEEVEDLEKELEERSLSVSSVSVMELWEGIHSVDSSHGEKQVVKKLLEQLKDAEFGKETAKKAGKISAELQQDGLSIEIEDIMIAATALENKETVVTGNDKHFERIEDLELKTY